MQPALKLSATEARVLGSLIEKEITTPDAYPLSLNGLVSACNQKSSREPVMQLTEREVETALRSLEDNDLVAVDHGSRVERYENRARTVFQLRRDETAVLCLLLLRGPQTPGELRSRADRLYTFDDIAAVAATLERMGRAGDDAATGRAPLVAVQPRQPGAREQRYQQLLSEAPPAPAASTESQTESAARDRPTTTASATELSERLAFLEDAVQMLEERLARLEATTGS